MYCEDCRHELAEGIKFCPNCGKAVQQQAPALMGSSDTSAKVEGKQDSVDGSDLDSKRGGFWRGWEWVLSFIIAFLFILSFALLTGESKGSAINFFWTMLWIYLTIEGWKLWKWRSLAAYPAFVVVGAIVVAFRNAATFGSNQYIGLLYLGGALNFAGLLLFYQLIRKARKSTKA